jgi:hypothetical protein
MKKHFLLIVILIASTFIVNAQAREDRTSILDTERAVLSIELNYSSKTVSDALAQKLKDAGIKTKSSKGFTIAEGAKFLEVSPENLDYFFKVESKDKTKSIVYLGFSKGYTNFITPESDSKTWAAAKTFLNDLVKYNDQYQLGLDIAAQEKVVKDSEKALEKSVKDGDDLTKKLEENKKDQETKKADVEKQKALLGDLNGKKSK